MIYPTMAEVMTADFHLLTQWDEKLDPPQTDVERAVRNRIRRRMLAATPEELRKHSPEAAASWEKLMEGIESLLAKTRR